MIGNVNVPGALAADIANKVDKISGKGLSTNDFTNEYKSKLDLLKNYSAGNGISIDNNGVISSTSNQGLSIKHYLEIYKSSNVYSGIFSFEDNDIEIKIRNYSYGDMVIVKWIGNGIIDGHSLFYNKNKLANLTFSGHFILGPDASRMFAYGGSTGFSLDLRTFDTSNVTNMYRMFGNVAQYIGFGNLDLSSFDTSNVTNMGEMFSACPSWATTLDLTSFNTSNVTNMDRMFEAYNTSTTWYLNDLYLGPNWDMRNVTSNTDMFRYFNSTKCTIHYCDTNNTYQYLSNLVGASCLSLRTDITY